MWCKCNPALPLQNGGAVVLLVWLIFVALFLALTYWVYKDAQRNSEHPAFLWAIVVFLAPILGLSCTCCSAETAAAAATRAAGYEDRSASPLTRRNRSGDPLPW